MGIWSQICPQPESCEAFAPHPDDKRRAATAKNLIILQGREPSRLGLGFVREEPVLAGRSAWREECNFKSTKPGPRLQTYIK